MISTQLVGACCVFPWLVFFPSLAVSIALFGFNLLENTLRDTLDLRLRGVQER